MSRARTGSGSVTVISRFTVSRTTFAVTCWSSVGSASSPRSSITADASSCSHQVRVRRHALGGEEPALVRVGGVALAGGHEEPCRGGVLRRRLPGEEGRRASDDTETEQRRPPIAGESSASSP